VALSNVPSISFFYEKMEEIIQHALCFFFSESGSSIQVGKSARGAGKFLRFKMEFNIADLIKAGIIVQYKRAKQYRGAYLFCGSWISRTVPYL